MPVDRVGNSAWSPQVLTIRLYPDDRASVGGIPLRVEPGTGLDRLRAVALRVAVDIAGGLNQSMRTMAFEPDGAVWPLVVHPDGRVAEDADAPPLVALAEENADRAPADPPGTAPRQRERQVEERPVTEPEGEPEEEWDHVVQAPLVPERLKGGLLRIYEAAEAGRLEAARETAERLEGSVSQEYGDTHPHTLQVRAVLGHVEVLAREWARAADIYLDVAEAWLYTAGERHSLARQNAANAHACWKGVTDRREAERIGRVVVWLWSRIPDADQWLRRAERRMGEIHGQI